MADLAEFSEDGFDAKEWINASCRSRPTEEPIEKFLAELEMRLQLSAEEIESTLQDHSSQAMRRIPFAVQEIYRLSGDVQGLQDQVKLHTVQVQRDAAEAAQSVSTISQLDQVKHNMESACSTLKEATELSGLFIKVEEVFAQGDLPKVAEILSSMRRSLSLVGDVPEFRAGRQKLRALEDRLQSMIEGNLAEALSRGAEQDEDTVKKLSGLLLAVDRLATVEQLYCTSRLAKVFSAWEDCSGQNTDATVWLPTFHARLLNMIEAEHKWCGRVLPQQQQRLLTALLDQVLVKTSKASRERLAGARDIGALAALQRDVSVFARGLAELLAKDMAPQLRQRLLQVVFEPLEDKVSSYGELEQAQLHSELAAAAAPLGAGAEAGGADDTDAVVKRLSASLRSAFTVAQSAVERCLGFTGGSELRSLCKALDSELAGYLAGLQAALGQLHARLVAARRGGSQPGASVPEAAAQDDVEEVSNTLRLIRVAGELSSQFTRLEAQLRSTITAAVPKLEALAAKGGSTASTADPVALRLLAAPERLERLQRLHSSLQDSRFITLPAASSQVDSFGRAVHSSVFDVLLARVRTQLLRFPELPEWRKEALAAPSFSAYPLPYVTSIGEYLMAMPQQLEVLMVEEGEEAADSEELAAEWLDKVVSGAAAQYMESILRLPELSGLGGMQLAADVEYFCNVMSALQVVPPASLLTLQLFAGQPAEQFAEAAKAAAAEGGVDVAVLKQLAQMRKLPLEL